MDRLAKAKRTGALYPLLSMISHIHYFSQDRS